MSKLLEQINTAPRTIKKLGEVFEIIDGDRGANYPSKTEFTKSGYCVFLNTKNVPSQGFDFENVDFISRERDELLRKGKLERNDIVMTTRGTIGNVAHFNNDVPFDCMRINSGMVILRSKPEVDRSYLYTLIKSSVFNAQLKNTSSGSAQPQLPIKDLKEIELDLPDLTTQKKIAEIIGAYDEKIENNNFIIKKLEATAQAIFKEWFVNFNFPGATGKMIDSELGEIPEGWKVDRLSEIIVFEGGAQPPKSEHIYEPRDGYVRFIQNRDYSNSSHITYIKESKKNKLCEVFDIMMDKYGDVGVPRWGLVGAYNVALAKIVPKIKNSREYLRSYFSQRAVFSLLSASAQASTRGSLNEGTFKGVTLIIPDEITLERFEKLQSKFLSKILFNNAEVETLSQLRDTLLPKLMKGDVRVEGFEN